MKILRYFNYREFPDGNHRIREELSSYGSAGDEIKNREAPDKNGRVGMSAFTRNHTIFSSLKPANLTLEDQGQGHQFSKSYETLR